MRHTFRMVGLQHLFLRICVILLLSAVAALAQQAPSAATQPALVSQTGHADHPAADIDIGLPNDTEVVNIRSHCLIESQDERERSPCAITVTKKEFDTLVQALDPKMDTASKQSLAAEYARLLIMASEARRRGLDRLPESQILAKYAAMHTLASQLVRSITINARPVSREEVEEYFRDHATEYRFVTLSRIVVPTEPKHSNHGMVHPEAFAQSVRARAIKGEDFSALQQEINGAARGETGLTPRIGPLPCLSLPEAHRLACDLQAGQISPLISDRYGYFIYRLESTRSRGLEEVREEVRAMLSRRRVEDEVTKVRTPASLVLNEHYFGKLPDPDLAAAHGMHFPATNVSGPKAGHTDHQ